MTVRYIGPSKSAGWHLDGGVLKQHCVCGHHVHQDSCPVGIVVAGVEQACGCPRTCPRCLNVGFYTVRRDDENVPVDCYCGAA